MMFFLPSFHWGTDYMMLQWGVGFVILALWLCQRVYQHSGSLFYTMSTAYIYLSAIYIFAFPHNSYASNPSLLVYLGSSAMYTALAFTAMLLLMFHYGTIHFSIISLLPWYGFANALYVIFGYFTGWGRLPQGLGYSGILDYSGMNSVLICLCAPFLLEYFYCPGQLLPLLMSIAYFVAMVMSRASIPYGVLAIIVLAHVVHKTRHLKWAIPAAFAPIIMGCAIRGKLFLDDAYRFNAYRTFMRGWQELANIYFGAGAGSFQILGPMIQVKSGFMMAREAGKQSFFWLWMHSDWLQCLFEYGIIGFSLILVSYIIALKRLYDDQKTCYSSAMFSLAVGVGGSAIFDYPLRYYSTALLVAISMGAAFAKTEDK